ncbi:hypothetical protein HID58_042056 [Brassica napus]|uniref:Uncharacterized protein n=1 Tax=Brassica napus TaxID=3708 RepID=A0ABQ8BCY2_BRANA|nr:hypothetical protein HID58_042056 [Brassica napus]
MLWSQCGSSIYGAIVALPSSFDLRKHSGGNKFVATTLNTGIGLQLARNEISGGISKETVVESENLQMQNAIQVNLTFTYVYAYN